tara:strand:- start:1469 stop:1696 length:228 start_codon:yes stop_codon:yes gene_type:complete
MANPNQKVGSVSEFPSLFSSADKKNEAPASASDIAQIKSDLSQIKSYMTPSIILTGPRVMDEYWRLITPPTEEPS